MVVTVSSGAERGKGTQVNGNYAVTNLTPVVSMDCSAVADNAIADVLGTLITDLIAQGIIKGSTVTH
jgi:hypothetical protein